MKNPMRVGGRLGPGFGLAREFAYTSRRSAAAIAFIFAIGQMPLALAQKAEGQGVRVENESRLVLLQRYSLSGGPLTLNIRDHEFH